MWDEEKGSSIILECPLECLATLVVEVIGRLIEDEEIVFSLGQERKEEFTSFSSTESSNELIFVVVWKVILNKYTTDSLFAISKSMYQKVFFYRFFEIKWLMHLGIVPDSYRPLEIDISFEFMDLSEESLDECAFSDPILTDDTDAFWGSKRSIAYIEEWFRSADESILDPDMTLWALFFGDREWELWRMCAHRSIEDFHFLECSFSTFCEARPWSGTESINQCLLTLEKRLLLFVCFLSENLSMLLFFHRKGIVPMIYHDPRWSENLDRCRTGTIEELTIVRYDAVSSFPGRSEVVLEPLYTLEIDEVRGFIEKEKVWTREECFCEGNLCSLSSWYCWYRFLEKIVDANPTSDSLDLVLVGISTEKFVSLESIGIGFIFSSFCELFFFCSDFLLELSEFREGISEIITYDLLLIAEVYLREIPETHAPDIFYISIILSDLSWYDLYERAFSDSIWPDDSDPIVSIHDVSYIPDDGLAESLVPYDVYFEMIHGDILAKALKKWKKYFDFPSLFYIIQSFRILLFLDSSAVEQPAVNR